MDIALKDKFIERWQRYFPNAEFPIVFYYSNDTNQAEVEVAAPSEGRECFIARLAAIRKGRSFQFEVGSIGCFGGRRYTGFSHEIMPNFEYFLSCGIEGKLEGERYKKTPEMVKQLMANAPQFIAPAKYIVFKRWDKLEAADDPAVVIFFAPPDVLAGLFTLAGFDEVDANVVMAPFGAGCGTIIQHPFLDKDSAHPHAFVGMFDVSARPYVPKETLSFAVPMSKFTRMINNMDESFLTTHSWEKVMKRL